MAALAHVPLVVLGPAPPTKSLTIFLDTPEPPPRRSWATGSAPASQPAPSAAVAAAKKVALDNVKANSILAQDIHFGEPAQLLVAAPTILTNAVLGRLKDLRQIHGSYSHVFVIEPAA